MGLSSGAMSYVYCFYVCIKTTEAVVGKLTPFGKMPMQKKMLFPVRKCSTIHGGFSIASFTGG